MSDRIKNVQAQKVQVDEIWTYVFKKQARISVDENAAGIGDQYVFVGIDSDTKLVISHLVGKRDAASCYYFMRDLKDRLATRVQLTTDGFKPYINAVDDTFGTEKPRVVGSFSTSAFIWYVASFQAQPNSAAVPRGSK